MSQQGTGAGFGTIGRTPRLSVFDVGVGLLLGAFGVALVTDTISSPGRHGGVGAALAVLTMTVPVIWRRQAPVAVAAALGAGAVLNLVAVGPMVRCGPALPALFISAFALGRQTPRVPLRQVELALACLWMSAVVQCLTDPNLDAPTLVALVPMTLSLYFVGRLVESRGEMVHRLRDDNAALARQRERVAGLAIQADRSRIAEGLEESISSQISDIASAAADGRRALAGTGDEEAAQEAFVTIERRGRETLQHMRTVVGALLETDAPAAPQPTLRELDRLVAGRTGPDVRVHVLGEPRVLPAGLELSGYRTLEHLLQAFGDEKCRVDVYVRFGTDALELRVCGPSVEAALQEAALASARARVAVHSGTLEDAWPDGEWEAVARLPLTADV